VSVNVSNGLRSRLPILSWAPSYRLRALRGDLLAGLVVAALAVPQALGYAGIAGVPVVVGIYAIPAALIAYAIFGSSPHLVVGPVSTVSVVSGSVVAPMAAGDAGRAATLTAALAIGSGLVLLAMGLLRLGWAAEFLSRPIVTGFVFGLVLVIIIGEIPKLFGLPPVTGDSIEQAIHILRHITELDPLTTLFGVAALAVLFLGARFVPWVPWGLVVLVAAVAISAAADLSGRGVVVVGEVPRGLPPIGLPGIEVNDIAPILFGGLALAMVGLAEGLSAARLFAAKQGYSIDSNQELLGSGAANIAAGISGGLGVAGSLSKTAASQRSGGRTQVTGLVTAVTVLLVIVLAAEWLAPLPRAVLSAIVIQAGWGLMDVAALKRYKWIRRNDFVSAIAAMIGVLLFGPLYGLLLAIGQSLLGLAYRFSLIDVDVMGRVAGEKAAWGSIHNHPERRTYDGIVVIRLNAPLFWANASDACELVLRCVQDAGGDVRVVLVDLEATSQLDTTSIDALELLLQRLRDRGIDLYLVRVFYQARQKLARAGFIDRLGEERMWHSISAGVQAARKAAELHGSARPQWDSVSDGDDADDAADLSAAAAEQIAVERTCLGGYEDPDRADHAPVRRRRWWHLN
jgi:high affinity sulfate transporter 1